MAGFSLNFQLLPKVLFAALSTDVSQLYEFFA